jgi:hypothetical protein
MIVLFLLVGCISSQPHAPFSMGLRTEAYFLEAGGNLPEQGAALLLLIDGEELDCDTLKTAGADTTGRLPWDSLRQAAVEVVGQSSGEGLLFMLIYASQDIDQDDAYNSYPTPDFEGFWAENSTVTKEKWIRNRALSSTPFYRHNIFEKGRGAAESGENPLWLKVDEITGTEIKGTFSADYWAGPFHGKDCGRSEVQADSGMDSWR